MQIHPALTGLLQSACPSIQSRLRVEVLGQPLPAELQNQILTDPLVEAVMGWRQPDGWLGAEFHGSRGIETGIRILIEKGLDPEHPLLAGALDALADASAGRLLSGIGQVGPALDALGFGGSEMIRAALLAQAGRPDHPLAGPQVERALAAFRQVTGVESLAAVTEEFRGKRVFKTGLSWPGIYALRLLAFSSRWRTPDNRHMLTAAVQRLVDLSPMPEIHVRSGSRWMAPAAFAMRDFNPRMEALDPPGWMAWFHRMEFLARLGVVAQLPALQSQLDFLTAALDRDGLLSLTMNHPYFSRWGAYTGLMLEKDWRVPARRSHDLTFRCLLFRHYSQCWQF